MGEIQMALLEERCSIYVRIISFKVYLRSMGTSAIEPILIEQLKSMEDYLEILDKRIGEWL